MSGAVFILKNIMESNNCRACKTKAPIFRNDLEALEIFWTPTESFRTIREPLKFASSEGRICNDWSNFFFRKMMELNNCRVYKAKAPIFPNDFDSNRIL